MKAKKNPKISIERKRGLFFKIGFVITKNLIAQMSVNENRAYSKKSSKKSGRSANSSPVSAHQIALQQESTSDYLTQETQDVI